MFLTQRYTGRNGTDLLAFAGAIEMEEDFSGAEISLRLIGGTVLTLRRGDELRKNLTGGLSVVPASTA